MSKLDDSGPAFPADSFAAQHAPGMSLRDWFAGQAPLPSRGLSESWACALMGEDESPGFSEEDGLHCIRWWAEAEARYRYLHADAMLSERAKSLNTSSEKDAG